VVCSHNGERTIGDCPQGLRELQYPDFEVTVVDDGSTDATAAGSPRHAGSQFSSRNCYPDTPPIPTLRNVASA
jgi:glycosyltransferase involved in cell wall biosynthesis